MDWERNYHRLWQCKKLHKKRHIRREIASFSVGWKTAIFRKKAKGGLEENFQKWPIFWADFGRLKNKKYKSHITLISMDWKRSYHRLWQWKKPHEKRHKKRNSKCLSSV